MDRASQPVMYDVDDCLRRLQVIARIGGMWLRGLPLDNYARSNALSMMSTVDAMISRQECSAESIEAVGTEFCRNCRLIQPQVASLCAAKRQSSKQGLDACWLMGLAP